MEDCAGESSSENSSPSSVLRPSISPFKDATASTDFSFKFRFTTNDTRTRILTSDTFIAGGYKWAIDFYPNGTRLEDDQYISLFITLESDATDVFAHFELILVDQNVKGKQKIKTNVGTQTPYLMKHQGSQWGFRRYVKKTRLQKSYLKNGCLIVFCRVAVLDSYKGENNTMQLATFSPVADQVQYLEPSSLSSSVDHVQQVKDHNLEDREISTLRSAVNTLFDTELGVTVDGEHDEFEQYLQAVDEIQKHVKLSNMSNSGFDLIQMAMERVLLEYRNILDWSICMVEDDTLCSTDCSTCIATSCSQELLEADQMGCGALSSEQIYRLRCMTERLNSAGRLQKCVEVYKKSRKSLVDASFSKFGIGNWGICDIRCLDWDECARKIKFWIRAAQMCFVIIIPREKQTCEQIFDGFEDVYSDDCFLDIVKECAIQLCNFAQTISTSPVSLQKLFDVLDLFKFLWFYLPDIRATFHSETTKSIFAQAERTLDRLANLIRKILSSFEDTVLHEQLNTPISRGTIHSLTRYTMERVIHMVHYSELLAEIITSEPIPSFVGSSEMQLLEVKGQKPLALHVIWIITSLKANLKVKFKIYKDTSLAHLFLMNNLQYIVEEINGSYELLEMIGKDYVTKLSKDVMEEAKSYLESWDKVLYCFRDEGLYRKVFYNGISKNALKDRFKILNAAIQEMFLTQSTWFVPDSQLRDLLHKSIVEKLLTAYKSFLLQFKSERYIEKYIKYSPEELHNAVYKLFN